MTHKIKCFLSYAHADQEFVREEIAPVLSDLSLDVWVDYEKIEWGAFIPDVILEGIRQAQIVITVFNRRSTYTNFEVGVALGQSKPILAIVRDEYIPTDLMHLNFLRYSKAEKQAFHHQLHRAIDIITNNLIDTAVFEAARTDRIIGIEIGLDTIDIEKELRFTADFLSLIKEITGSPDVSLLQTRKGSFTSFFSLDLRAWAELIEKVIFFIPEWQKKKAENLKILAETKKIEAETNHINTNTMIAEERLRIEQAEAMIRLLEKYKELGIKIQFGEEMLLSLDPTGMLTVKEPERLQENR
jgi:nucleoside 2-deoxyribosyltransferase